MILDLQSLMSDAQAIVATAVSTNVIDLGATESPPVRSAPTVGTLVRDQGAGEPTPILIQVVEAFDALTSLTIDIEKDTVEGFGSAEVVDSQSILLADLVIGQIGNVIWVPYGANQRYLRMNYTVVGSNPTVGKITAGLCMGVQTNITG